ncbi:MAG TPA: four-carbon acid sugar kinase family protein [Flavisolibacter sp.]|nr:four-carbon acid sugar kinase family protein [Flavisolibacter sp.]
MIVVIADDLTGAAEIGGIGLRYGLKVLLSPEAEIAGEVDLLVIYTNTRSLTEGEAVVVMQKLTRKAALLKPSLFYKKTDSVLRGHVLAEMKTQMNALGLNKALLVPVNPMLGRTIQNRHYYINGRPVHETGFADDPEFPIKNSGIESMLNAGAGELQLLSVTGDLPDGITVGEASTMNEVRQWASNDENNTFYAGAASFFAALLHHRFVAKKVEATSTLSLPLLLVSGTTYQQNINKQQLYAEKTCYMPEALLHNIDDGGGAVKAWASDVVKVLGTEQRCMMAIGNHASMDIDPGLLKKNLSAAVKLVLQRVKIKELMIEGGATAYSIISELGFTLLRPTAELQQGVVRMEVTGVDDMHLTIKPGSYAWPEVWENAFGFATIPDRL